MVSVVSDNLMIPISERRKYSLSWSVLRVGSLATGKLVMRKVRNWLKVLIVPLVLASSGQGKAPAADALAEIQQTLSTPSDGEIVTYDLAEPDKRWYFRSEGLALKRYARDTQPFAGRWNPPVVDPDAPVPGFHEYMLGTNDLDFEFQGGYRLTLGRKIGDWSSVEFTYYDVGDWSEMAAVRNVEPNDQGSLGNLMSPFTDFGNPPVVGLDYNNLISIQSSSQMDNMELNFWREIPMPADSMGVSIMAGLRYMSILEQFQYDSTSAEPTPLGATNMVNTRTGNDLLGVQLGALFEFPVDPGWWIDWELKGTIARNDARQNTQYVNVNQGNQTSFSTGRAENRTTFVGETSVRLIYEFSPRMMVYAGYQAVWVDGLALASENVPTDQTSLMIGPGQLDHDGNLVYHGPHIGSVLTW